MAGLTTHVLDLTSGKPAEGLNICLFKKDSENAKNLLGNFVTNSDGRISQPLLNEKEIMVGWYELIFFAGDYLKAFHKMKEEDLFLDNIPIQFQITNIEQHYHVPLLLSKYGYSTYRGS
tara:strand:- start:2809 stop:3165 length:357 start_codon:yes stop_codon:yes gene_type:complete